MVKIIRSIDAPVRAGLSTETLWAGEDKGLIACWERGREKAIEEPALAKNAALGHLPPLAWKGGVSKKLKQRKKYGTYFYLATWQGLRGQDLFINTDTEITITCSRTDQSVTFTSDYEKYKAS